MGAEPEGAGDSSEGSFTGDTAGSELGMCISTDMWEETIKGEIPSWGWVEGDRLSDLGHRHLKSNSMVFGA